MSMILPACPAATASGLIIVKVLFVAMGGVENAAQK
jgi:hypothetical protein